MGDEAGLFSLGDLDHALGDEGAGDAGAEEVLAFVNGSRLDHRVDEVGGELFLQIVDVDLGGTGFLGLGVEALQFVVLADVGAESDDFGVVGFLDPGEKDGGVEAAGVC